MDLGSYVALQHTIIDENINKLEDVIINRSESIYNTKEIIKDLIIFFEIHFITERIIMERYNVIDNEHLKSHSEFLEKLKNLLKLEKIEIQSILYLRDWEKEHINKFDTKLVQNCMLEVK